ncbi:MAG: PAS domain S-box protein, partial [Syntrophothermus sp.]
RLLYTQIVHPDDLNKVKAEVRSLISGQTEEFTQDYRIMTKSGKVCWVDDMVWIKKDEYGAITHFQGIVIDITRRKITEQLLRESEERYRALAENSYDLICEISSELHFLYISPNFKDMLGYVKEDLLNKSILEFVHPDDIPGVIATLKKDIGSIILRLQHKDGEWKWFESAGKKFITAGGQKKGVVVSRDISERKKLEQQLIQTEKLMAVGEMSAMIAHEFRNALTSVKIILQLQNESVNLNPDEKNLISVAINSIYHMENIVQQLLNFAHPAPLELKIDNINKVIADCIPFIELQATKKGISIKKKFDYSLPDMFMNGPAVKDSIINLLLNAVQAIECEEEKSEKNITVSVKRAVITSTIRDFDSAMRSESRHSRYNSADEHDIIIEAGSECALIEIKDNGPGIEQGLLTRIFEPFFTTKEKGSGLGLPIVKRTINSHGGIITVDSIPGKGTSFKIYLPTKLIKVNEYS